MQKLNNPLASDSNSKPISPSDQIKKKLRGQELVNFVEAHKQDFNGNGDQLCIEAGYGKYAKNGKAVCNFKNFVKELSKVMDLENKKNNIEN